MLDEPVGGLSPKEVGDSIALFQRLNQEFGLTVIIIEHVMRVLTEIAGRLLILSSGESIMCDSPAAVCAHPDIIDLYLGHAEAEAVCEWEGPPDA
jgi:branched-chain amino acid transport system ATP-binding protein